jgi:ATP-dependent DNA helicase 2 subunit 1
VYDFRFALAFYGNPTRPQLVALVAQVRDSVLPCLFNILISIYILICFSKLTLLYWSIKQEEVTSSGGQFEPPGMHMICFPYSDDIRYPEEVRTSVVFNFTITVS